MMHLVHVVNPRQKVRQKGKGVDPQRNPSKQHRKGSSSHQPQNMRVKMKVVGMKVMKK